MRTTLTLDDDVAAQLLALQQKRQIAFKVAVNEVLRAGLMQLTAKVAESRASYVIKPVSLGAPRLPSLDNIADVLAVAEGEDTR